MPSRPMESSCQEAPDQPQGGTAKDVLRNRWFVGCVVVVAILTAGFELIFHDTVIRKLPVPLKKKLAFLDQQQLKFQDAGQSFSYRLKGQPIQFEPEMIDALGTEDYIAWNLQLWDDSARKTTGDEFSLSVTYYTGNPDQVPHVSETCGPANGNQLSGDRMVRVEVPGLPEKDRTVPVKVLLFQRKGQNIFYMVMYTFRVNDLWRADRDDVRWVLGDFFSKYAYFSKIELTIPLPNGFKPVAVDRGIEVGSRFLQTVLPVLMRDHWQEIPHN